MDEQRLRKSYIVYIVTAVLFTAALSTAVFVQRYCSEVRDTVDRLRTLSGSSVRVKRATQSAREALMKIKSEIPATYLSSPVENVVFQAVDIIRERTRNTEIVVETLRDRSNVIELPIVVKGTLDNYADFLTTLHLLESLRFPFFVTNELVMTHEIDGPVRYELKGSIRTRKPLGAIGSSQGRRG